MVNDVWIIKKREKVKGGKKKQTVKMPKVWMEQDKKQKEHIKTESTTGKGDAAIKEYKKNE